MLCKVVHGRGKATGRRPQVEITVKDVTIKTMTINGIDYICITDIAKQKNAVETKDVVKNWMRQKNTLEYLGLWERLNNPNFKGVEFAPLLAEAGNNSFIFRDYATINELVKVVSC